MYPDHLTAIIQSTGLTELPSWINPEAKNARLILPKNVLFTLRTHSFSFFFGTLWALPSCVSDLQTLRPLKNLYHVFLAKPPDFF